MLHKLMWAHLLLHRCCDTLLGSGPISSHGSGLLRHHAYLMSHCLLSSLATCVALSFLQGPLRHP